MTFFLKLYFLFVGIGFFGISCNSNAQEHNQIDYPEFTFLDMDSMLISNKDIPKDKPLMLIYFRIDCDYCKRTVQRLRKEAASYPAKIWLISGEEFGDIRNFEEMTDLYDIDNLKTLQDYTRSMHNWFNFSAVPHFVLFDQYGKKIKEPHSMPSSAEIIQLVNQ